MEEKPKKASNRKQGQADPDKSHFTTAELGEMKRLLLEKCVQITGDVSLMEKDVLKKTRGDAAGDLSAMPIHMADIGTDNYEQEFALGLLDSERTLLREIYEALQRIDEGTYGVCEGDGEPIATARLKANPWARYCLNCARKAEFNGKRNKNGKGG